MRVWLIGPSTGIVCMWSDFSSLPTDSPKEVNYLYAIPLKQFYNETITVATKSSISPYQVPHSKGATLFCTSPLTDQFLRLAVAVKNRVYMLAYKHPASMVLEGSTLTTVLSTSPKENFIKHQVSGRGGGNRKGSEGWWEGGSKGGSEKELHGKGETEEVEKGGRRA